MVPIYETSQVNIFSIHIKENNMKIYLSHKEARNSPNEVYSFLMDYLNYDTTADVEELHMYSDKCMGQNKNHALSRLLCALS